MRYVSFLAVSPEGRCRSFDDSAHGYGRGEGVGAVILKNISQAIRDGDHILAVIKGTAVGQDGNTAGIMAPNGTAQETVAKKALKVAGIDPSSIRYVEAHATSTPLGDPTEVSALANVYGKDRSTSEPCYIGSLKPNIGHLEVLSALISLYLTPLSHTIELCSPLSLRYITNSCWRTWKLTHFFRLVLAPWGSSKLLWPYTKAS